MHSAIFQINITISEMYVMYRQSYIRKKYHKIISDFFKINFSIFSLSQVQSVHEIHQHNTTYNRFVQYCDSVVQPCRHIYYFCGNRVFVVGELTELYRNNGNLLEPSTSGKATCCHMWRMAKGLDNARLRGTSNSSGKKVIKGQKP